jgi:hypothetical protein
VDNTESAIPIATLSSAVLSTSGVFLALFITRTEFNVSSFMGLIMVVGIVAKNGILLLDANQKYLNDGMPREEAMIHAGRWRLRPIVMTALAASCRPASVGAGDWGRVTDVAAPRDCSHWWDFSIHGSVADDYTRNSLLCGEVKWLLIYRQNANWNLYSVLGMADGRFEIPRFTVLAGSRRFLYSLLNRRFSCGPTKLQ